MSATASMFKRFQKQETKMSGKGRRFNMDEKMSSLSVFKRSPECYRMLSILFTLPSKRTLNTLLFTIAICLDIYSLIMDMLKENIKN